MTTITIEVDAYDLTVLSRALGYIAWAGQNHQERSTALTLSDRIALAAVQAVNREGRKDEEGRN